MRVNSVKTETDHIIEDYSDVLADEIGCLPGEYDIKIDQTVTHSIHLSIHYKNILAIWIIKRNSGLLQEYKWKTCGKI